MLIRQEQPLDHLLVHDLIIEAFKTAEHRDGSEQDLVDKLRRSPAFIPRLSLVAEIGGELAGHILFTKAQVGTKDVLVLAPLSVRPKFQRQGIGTALIAEGHSIAEELGYQYSLVLGSERYYPRMGYVPAEQLGVEVPKGFPSSNFMAIRLQDGAEPLCGPVVYPKEFGLQ